MNEKCTISLIFYSNEINMEVESGNLMPFRDT